MPKNKIAARGLRGPQIPCGDVAGWEVSDVLTTCAARWAVLILELHP